MVPKRYILPPPSLKPWPEIKGYESVFVGSGIYQELMPRGVKKIATILTSGNDEWIVTDYIKDLVYPAGQDELFYVFYFNKKT